MMSAPGGRDRACLPPQLSRDLFYDVVCTGQVPKFIGLRGGGTYDSTDSF